MFEQFSDRARKVMAFAHQAAQRLNHDYLGTEHLLLGLLKERRGVGANVLIDLKVDLDQLRKEVEKLVKVGPDAVVLGRLPQTPGVKNVILNAVEESHELNQNYVGTEHLLLGLLREKNGVAAKALSIVGVKLEAVRQKAIEVQKSSPEAPPG